MNLLMLSGDSSVAQGRDSTFLQMLGRFAAYWDRIDVLCPPAKGAQPRAVYGNVYVHPSPSHKIAQPTFIAREGAALLSERPYALIASHDYGLFLNGAGAWRLKRATGVPVVSEIHHVEGYPRAVTRRERLYRRTAFTYIRWAKRWAAAFRVVNAGQMPNLLRRFGVPEQKILVLPSLYIDFDVFHPLPDQPRRYDVLFVGRLVANKGLFTLLSAIKLVSITHPNVRLGILGSGPLERALKERVASLGLGGNVTFLPHQPDAASVARLYTQAGLVVCASTAEGGPRVTVEAMACGVPVVSTPVGVMADLIEDGENGLLVNWSVGDLAAKIRMMLEDGDLHVRLAEAGRETVQEFDADRVVEAYARGYHDLIARLRSG
ncbi:glycosyltransferase family 4 protein [Aggregatilinea lenta]|uniref:glycosyltransferase family 4 protein n=1 Tax=Aggregatilinea lenta TaxID=913108 RepID=UPI000E5A6C04|nr:glycosyltransferase family 4 protein [Aggregatilinea lenta]